jgi:hypothetical protein
MGIAVTTIFFPLGLLRPWRLKASVVSFVQASFSEP